VAVALVALPAAVAAQSYFGQNQVQYGRFDWKVLETEHFLIYYYPATGGSVGDAARLAERSYARLSRILDHQFSEKKPIVLFASRTDFAQNNVTGDLGEATGGATEALRHRMLLNFTGDLRSFEHVLAHEMVHAFQYDIFARGKAGAGLHTLAQVNPPLWFSEGMAEYLSLGPSGPLTDMWMRDAAVNGRVPTVRQMTDRPDRYFPYRFGHSFWTFIGEKYGDEAIGQIMQAVPVIGIERAFRRELGASLDDLGDEWREVMQSRHLADIGTRDRPRKIAQPLLTERRSEGEIFLAPALSSDGRHVAFLANGRLSRGEVFIDLWLGDARSGRRIRRLAKSTTDADFEELRFLYSQGAFTPDGSQLAFVAQTRGRDVLYLLDVASRRTVRRFELPLDGMTSPTFSPDGSRIAFSGSSGGVSDLYVIDVDGRNLRRLTGDSFTDVHPAWSPDGRRIAFASDRGGTDSDILKLARWEIAVIDLESGDVETIPGQEGLNLNPQWSPDSRSIAYVSDRTGTANVFLVDLESNSHFQLTQLLGGVAGLTEYSPAISWAQKADMLAITSFENGRHSIWTISNPRALKRPITKRPTFAALASEEGSVSIAQLLDSATFGLPDTTQFIEHEYRVRFQPDYVARPSFGYAPDNVGRNVFGGTTVILSDVLGNHRLAFAAEVNGRFSEARLFAGYTNVSRRWQYSTGISQAPYFFLSADRIIPGSTPNAAVEHQEITSFSTRQLFLASAYPLNRFTRVELGSGFNNVGRRRWFIQRDMMSGVPITEFRVDSARHDPALNYFDAHVAYVSDNTLVGRSGPLLGRRYRVQVAPVAGSLHWVEYLADYRRYDPVVFNELTFATRLYTSVSVGRDETKLPKYIARPDYVRGYDRNNSFYLTCPVVGANATNCGAVQLLGSRVAVFNAELRFPVVRYLELGFLPFNLPPIDGLAFFDAGLAWSQGQSVYGARPENFDVAIHRYPLRSYGAGLRVNLFNYAMLRFDYAIPLDQSNRKGFWTWSLWPSF
jgi:Tol biopolymer transport system component